MSLDTYLVLPWTADEVREALAAYRLGPLLSGPAPMPEAGWDSQRARCRVKTASGAWFLKKHHPAIVRNETHSLVRAFQEGGGRAPQVMARADGETWLTLPGGAVSEVQRIAPGRPLRHPSDEEALEATEQLALWQRVPTDLVPPSWSGWYDSTDVGRIGRQGIEKLRLNELPTEELQDAFAEERASPRYGRDCVVHGDLWLGNWVTDGGHVVGLTDFDWVHRGSRTEGVVDLVLAMCSARDSPLSDNSSAEPHETILRGRMAQMIHRYESLCGELSHEERIRLPAQMRSYWLRHAVWLLRALEQPAHLRIVLDRTLRFMRELPRLAQDIG